MLKTPKGLRLHIALFGRTNVGKSSLLNCITGQDISIVSQEPGTTTDPIEKPMELLPIGPVLFIDTAGLDDISTLGKLRIDKTIKVLDRADLIILVIEPNKWTDYEDFVLEQAKDRETPILVVINKIDLIPIDSKLLQFLTENNIPFVSVSSIDRSWNTTNIVKSKIIELLPQEFITPKSIIPDNVVKEDDFVILVIPIDKEAPKGRIILPQQQVLRELLDKKAVALVCQDTNLDKVLKTLTIKPKLLITDSQRFEEVFKIVPNDILVTSFSILFANNKGDIFEFINGVNKLKELNDGDKVLILEACTHHPIGEDIGRIKIPNWIKQKINKNIIFEVYSGKDLPTNLTEFKLIIHCGGCMLNRKEVLSRTYKAKFNNIPITNYGVITAFLKDGLERSIEVFNYDR